MLLIVATRYDEVTRRTFAVAENLRQESCERKVPTTIFFESRATRDALEAEIRRPFQVVAFFSHGDDQGRMLAQDREPFWKDENTPDFHGGAIVAHACLAMLYLETQRGKLRAKLLVGYRVDLKLPPEGSDLFWDRYRRLHVLFPLRLVEATDVDDVRREFYSLGTECIAEVHRHGGSLIELIALQQSRDDLVIWAP